MNKTRLSTRLRELRKSHFYTQDYVASYIGVIRQTYSHYETGRCIPPYQSLYKLAGLYGVEVEDLLHLTMELNADEYEIPAPSESSISLEKYLSFFNDPFNRKKYKYFSDDEKELMYYFSILSKVDRRELIDIAKIKFRKY